MRFFDTNILVYAVDGKDARKQKIALALLSHSMDVNHDGAISVQVLSEFANILLGKFSLSPERTETFVSLFYPLLRTEVTADMVRSAMFIKREYGIQYYDALIVAAAETVLVFWDGLSAGTRHVIDLCEKTKTPYSVILCEGD